MCGKGLRVSEKRVEFEYAPRAWQKEVLEALKLARLAVVVAHRRAGKTEVMCLRLLLAALTLERAHPAPFFGYVAPFLNQAKAVAWDRLKYYTRSLQAAGLARVNESELTLSLWNGAAIRLFGADYPDRLRGLGFDGVVMDEVAQMRPETWPGVVRPALADRGGWAVFIGTPKGVNVFYELYERALERPGEWYAASFPVDRTGVLAEEELLALRREIGEDVFRREFLCDFTADAAGIFIDFQSVYDAARAERPLSNLAPLVFGLDVARFGDDRSVLLARRGRVVEDVQVWQGRDLMWTSSAVSGEINRCRPRAVFVDAVGVGAGVVDRLRQLGHRVIGVNSGARSGRADQYSNLKAEMWDKMRQWLSEGAVIPDREDLKKDLLATAYSFDAGGRLKIESKDELKKRVSFSTDLADALALTFAQPVPHEDLRVRRPQYAEM